jgi:hypothetical protein
MKVASEMAAGTPSLPLANNTTSAWLASSSRPCVWISRTHRIQYHVGRSDPSANFGTAAHDAWSGPVIGREVHMHTAQRGNFRRFGLAPPVSGQPRSTGSGRQPAFNSRPFTTAPSRRKSRLRLASRAHASDQRRTRRPSPEGRHDIAR